MSKRDITTKLAVVEAKLRRWQTRLTRASNEVTKLLNQQRRLRAQIGQPTKKRAVASESTDRAERSDPVIEAKADLVQAVDDRLTQIIEGKPDTLDIPVFMQRSLKQPVSDEERKKMPLSGREAEAFLKAQSAKVTKRRAKKELALRPK